MSHHHKTNATVEGNPDSGHGRGLPRRPDDTELEQRADLDRVEAGLPVKDGEEPRRTRTMVDLEIEAEES